MLSHIFSPPPQLYSRVCRRFGSAATSGTPGNLTVLGGGATGAGRDVARLLRYAARAHTETGAFAAAIPLLAKAAAEDPADCAHRFNLAYAQVRRGSIAGEMGVLCAPLQPLAYARAGRRGLPRAAARRLSADPRAGGDETKGFCSSSSSVSTALLPMPLLRARSRRRRSSCGRHWPASTGCARCT